MPRIFLIDGNSQMYRAYHAIRGLTGPDGKSTNAIYGFVNMLRKLIADHRPEYIVASFDLPGRTFRDDLAADYKANRLAMPEDLATQLPYIIRLCEAFNIPVINAPGFEADDVMGTLAKQAERQGLDTYLVTGDKDLMQLVSPRVKIYSLRKVDNQQEILDVAGVQQKFGVPP